MSDGRGRGEGQRGGVVMSVRWEGQRGGTVVGRSSGVSDGRGILGRGRRKGK